VTAVASLLPPPVRDERGRAFAACVEASESLDPWQACPAKASSAPDEVLHSLAFQNGVAALWHAMSTRAQKEALVASAPLLQRRRGTPWAVEEIMRVLGFTDAFVLDRVRLLLYDGDAFHDGAHDFEAGFPKFGDYLIRLYLGPKSRPLRAAGRAAAAELARVWSPLRSNLLGFHARHVLETPVDDPAVEAAAVRTVVLKGPSGQTATVAPLKLAQGGSVTVRWRLASVPLPEVSALALHDGHREFMSADVPPIEGAPDVTYEGTWNLVPRQGA
jgi:hypothetical protein